MKNFQIAVEDRKKIIQNINKIIGQLESIKREVEENEACEETFYLLLAAKGACNRVGKDMVNKGLLSCMSSYSQAELEKALDLLFKID